MEYSPALMERPTRTTPGPASFQKERFFSGKSAGLKSASGSKGLAIETPRIHAMGLALRREQPTMGRALP